MTDYTARLAIHESCHCVANFLLHREIVDAEITDNEGIVRVVATDDTFDAIVALLAPLVREEMLGFEPSGDTGDEDEAMAILRRSVAPGTVDQAFGVLWEAAGELVASARFDSLVRALAPILRRERVLQGIEIEQILLEADQRSESLTRKPGLERHSLSPTDGPGWWLVTIGGRVIYRGSDQAHAKRLQVATHGAMLTGSVYGWPG